MSTYYSPESMRGIWFELVFSVASRDQISGATLEQFKPISITTDGKIEVRTSGRVSREKAAKLADLLTQAWRIHMDSNSQPVRLEIRS
jgi:hypothetical protein